MKKLLSLLLVGLFTGISFASANSLDNGLTSDSEIITMSCDTMGKDIVIDGGYQGYICLIVSPSTALQENGQEVNFVSYNDNSIHCSNRLESYNIYSFKDYLNSVDCYKSSSPITWALPIPDTPSDDDNTPILGGVSDSFANGITSGVSSLLSGFGNIIPTLLLLGLPLLIITIFWNRIRSYLKHVLVGNKPRGDDIANCNLTLNKYGQFEHHIIGQHDHGDYVDIPGVGLVGKDELPYYLDENLNFKAKEYKQDHNTFDSRDPGVPGDDYYKRSENIEEEAYYYRKYL